MKTAETNMELYSAPVGNANAVLGEILNPFDGETSSVIRSNSSGIVYFVYNTPLINENTACFKIIRD
ncbi:MAG: hypothetical protein PUB66_08660 [Oscillospiraceae bacterium]|nr:hypothetical protein [Ruminococcus sp.]MDD6098770.1 hypothetical protein [Oscillospiraceae bacterium]